MPEDRDVFIKICGLREATATTACAELGVDAVGFVFAAGSVRYIDPDAAAHLTALLPPEIERVGVFTIAPVEEILETVRIAGLSTAQLHGHRSLEDIERLQGGGIRVIVAQSVGELRLGVDRTPGIRLLIDGDEPGSGTSYELDDATRALLPESWILAGGLTPENVAGRISALRPSGVDVSSGVESARGVKSVALINEFVARVREATASKR